jgi:hypothetical protein
MVGAAVKASIKTRAVARPCINVFRGVAEVEGTSILATRSKADGYSAISLTDALCANFFRKNPVVEFRLLTQSHRAYGPARKSGH